ncbi:MAG: ComF family protein, partial [Anaerovoracaceae bacterium]
AKILADRVRSDAGAAELLEADFIIPVPMHRKKEKQRGFNQAAMVAAYLGGFLEIPVLKDGLERAESTAAQRSIAGGDRLSNLHGAFRAGCGGRLSERIAGKRIILLDDIFTTGATAICCGRVLKEAGAARVDVLTVASGNDGAEGFSLQRNGKSVKIEAELFRSVVENPGQVRAKGST